MSIRPAIETITPDGTAITDAVERANAFQDRLVADYLEPHAVTFTYWAFALVFFYLGLQKVVPHRSTADVQLGTIAALVGLPYIPFVTFVGLWQMTIGGLFLARRLRLCAWFFFSYQVFTFSTLLVLRKIVFQPPWITVLGVDVPWALGGYSAFIMKNLIFAAIFFVLASHELDTDGSASTDEPAETPEDGGYWTSLVEGTAAFLHVPQLPGIVKAAGDRLDRSVATPLSQRATRLVDRVHAGQNHLVTNYFRPHGLTILYWSFAFVFFYFGFQKPAPVYSPVRDPLAEFFPHFGIPLATGMVFIGLYEMFLGLLFFFKEIRVAFWFFLPHQAVTFFSLLVIPFVAFQPPWITVLGVRFPWALTGFGAFVVKNLVFVAGFILLASIELGGRSIDGNAAAENGNAAVEAMTE